MVCVKAIDRTLVRRGTEVLSAVGFGLLGSVQDPGVGVALVLGVIAVLIGSTAQGFRTGLTGLAVLVVVSAARAIWVDEQVLYAAAELPSALLRSGVPWLVAVAVRQYIVLGRRAEQERRLRSERQSADLERRATAERLALARSLHDDLGHALSLVALNLGRLELDPDLVGTSRTAISRAREDLGDAVERLGASVVGLRSGTLPATPGIESVDTLIARARRAGARIEVTGFPDGDRLAPFDAELISRVLREAITNATRHAPAEVIVVTGSIEDSPGGGVSSSGGGAGRCRLRIRVANGAGGAADATGGAAPVRSSGIGLAELADALGVAGGGLDVESTDERFILTATIPADDSRARAEGTGARADEAGEGTGSDLPDRRRWRVLVSAAVVIVIGLGAGEVATVYWSARAHLPAGDFDRIGVGDGRSEVEALLPQHELPRRHGAPGERGCHDYAVSTTPFSNTAGDVYRICFSEGVVTRADHLTGGDDG